LIGRRCLSAAKPVIPRSTATRDLLRERDDERRSLAALGMTIGRRIAES
jgi:hypothetical protein